MDFEDINPEDTAGYVQVNGLRHPERRDQVEAGENLQFDVIGVPDGSVVETDFKRYKKTVPTYATQMKRRFLVDTIEGPQQVGQVGDFLVIGAAGEMYPVAQDIFSNTYELDG